MTKLFKHQEACMPGHFYVQMMESGMFDLTVRHALMSQMTADGVCLDDLLRPGAQAPFRWLWASLPNVNPDYAAWVGYRLGELTRITSHDQLSVPLLCAPTLEHFFQLFRFIPLVTNTIRAVLHNNDDALMVILEPNTGEFLTNRTTVYYCISAIANMLTLLIGQSAPVIFNLKGSKPTITAPTWNARSMSTNFDSSINYLSIPKPTLAMRSIFADELTYQESIRKLESLMQARPGSMIFRLRDFIDQWPGQPSIEHAAEAFNMSPSTLKRQLSAHGTFFKKILENSLQTKAVILLAESGMGLNDIAETLGYSDASNFSHAFKRWTGTSPGSFRKARVMANPTRYRS